MTEMIPTLINEQWEILLPEHRAVRPEWPHWERARMESIHRHLPFLQDRFDVERPIMWDVGAEEGDMAGLFSMWGYDIVLIEPNPRVWPNMKAIWEANNLPDPLACIVGFLGPWREAIPQLDGVGFFHGWPPCADGPVIGDHGFMNLWERPDVPSFNDDRIYVKKTGLRPHAITIDVEGAELRVLQEIYHTLHTVRPYIWVSIHRQEILDAYRHTADELHAFMEGYDYNGVLLDDAAHEQHWLFSPKESR